MIRTMLFASASVAVLALAVPAYADSHGAGEAADTASGPAAPTMDFGEWGVGLDVINPEVDPGDDFNAYVNGLWVANNAIPADRQRYGAFDMLREKSVSDVETLIRDIVASNPQSGTTARRIVDAYNAYLDMAAIDAKGLAPAQPYLDQIDAASDLAALVALMEEPGYASLVSASVGIDGRNPTDYAVSLGFDGMGLPDRDYYLVDSESNLAIREKYLAYLATMLDAAGEVDPAGMADKIFAFETEVAKIEWARQMLRIPNLTYNRISREELDVLSGDFPIQALLEAGQFGEESVFLVRQLPTTAEEIAELELTEEQLGMIGGGLPAMMKLLTETPLDVIKAYMKGQFVAANADVLSSELDAANFEFFGRTIDGREEQQPRWKRAISAVEGQLGEQLGALYVARYFPPESKEQMQMLVGNLSKAMNASLDENDWMTQATIEQARAKLDGFVPMVGYPDEFETYDGIEITGGDPLANRMSTMAWRIKDNRERLGTKVDPSEWGMLPQTVNAYYSPLTNRIVFPAAILQPPFFNAGADPAVNYGGIGAVIGHEIGHGYDDQGSQYDATGTLRNWWQPEDRKGFEAFTEKMGTFIEGYCPVDSEEGPVCLRARQSMGETLGDVVGLQMAYRAYKLSLNGKEAPVIDGLTGDQRFFLGFGQIWRGMEREESLRNRVMTANHPPGEFRLNNAVRHFDAWYEAFNVTPDDDLYLPPEERVSIW